MQIATFKAALLWGRAAALCANRRSHHPGPYRWFRGSLTDQRSVFWADVSTFGRAIRILRPIMVWLLSQTRRAPVLPQVTLR